MRASKILKIASRVLLVLVAVLNAGCSSENRAEMFRVLAEQGDAEAQNNLGKCYRDGIGVSQDYAEAAKWFQRSAEQGNADAQNNLGARYHTGTGVPLSHSEAVKWYRLLAVLPGTPEYCVWPILTALSRRTASCGLASILKRTSTITLLSGKQIVKTGFCMHSRK